MITERIADMPLLYLLRMMGTVEPCGSRVTCDPPPIGTDQDWLVEIASGTAVQVQTRVADAVDTLSRAGFRWEGGEHYQQAAGGGFMSWRRGDVNVLLTASHEWAEKHRLATWVCRRLNLLDKTQRITLFQAVLYGARWVGPPSAPASVKPTSIDDTMEF